MSFDVLFVIFLILFLFGIVFVYVSLMFLKFLLLLFVISLVLVDLNNGLCMSLFRFANRIGFFEFILDIFGVEDFDGFINLFVVFVMC